MATTRNIKTPPPPFEVVVLTFKGHVDGALGYHTGTTYHVAREAYAFAPVHWAPVEDNLLCAWAEIPRALPCVHPGELYDPKLVLPTFCPIPE